MKMASIKIEKYTHVASGKSKQLTRVKKYGKITILEIEQENMESKVRIRIRRQGGVCPFYKRQSGVPRSSLCSYNI